MVKCLDLVSMFSDGELVSIMADIKSAFMRIPIHLKSMGTFAMEWDGWVFIFNRTCFGWKYATYTFSDFTKAIKLRHKRVIATVGCVRWVRVKELDGSGWLNAYAFMTGCLQKS